MSQQRSKGDRRGKHRSHISGRRYFRRKHLDEILSRRTERLIRELGLEHAPVSHERGAI